MPDWKHHVFVCTNKRPPGHPKGSCADRGANELRAALAAAIDANDLYETVKLNTSDCLGPCRQGPCMVVYPENTWYAGATAADAAEIVQSHFVSSHPVERLLLPAQES